MINRILGAGGLVGAAVYMLLTTGVVNAEQRLICPIGVIDSHRKWILPPVFHDVLFDESNRKFYTSVGLNYRSDFFNQNPCAAAHEYDRRIWQVFDEHGVPSYPFVATTSAANSRLYKLGTFNESGQKQNLQLVEKSRGGAFGICPPDLDTLSGCTVRNASYFGVADQEGRFVLPQVYKNIAICGPDTFIVCEYKN